jgi:hypothetical protein
MEVTCSSETSVYFQRTIWLYIPENGTLRKKDVRCNWFFNSTETLEEMLRVSSWEIYFRWSNEETATENDLCYKNELPSVKGGKCAAEHGDKISGHIASGSVQKGNKQTLKFKSGSLANSSEWHTTSSTHRLGACKTRQVSSPGVTKRRARGPNTVRERFYSARETITKIHL